MMHRLFALLLLTGILLSTGCENAPRDRADTDTSLAGTTLLLVRHAEKANDGSENPPLTIQGMRRARLLRDMLVSSGIQAIYATRFTRNQQTVQPLADSLGIPVITYEADPDPSRFISDILTQHRGQRVLICGHSNTVPNMLNFLTGENTYTELASTAYNHLFVVHVLAKGKAAVMDLTVRPGSEK